jgi:tetratricopeptide (TPR) repeat protein
MKKSFVILFLINSIIGTGQILKIPEKDNYSFQYALTEASRQKMIGDINEAIALYENCIKTDPKCDVAYYELGTIYSALNNNQKSEENLEKAFNLVPNNYWYGIAYSELLKVNNKRDKSLEVLKSIRDMDPTNSLTINYKIAEIYSDDGKYKKAIKILDNIEKENGLSEMVSFMKIETYKKMRNLKLAEAEIKILIENNPDYSGYQVILAEFYTEKKDTTSAIAAYEQAYNLDSTSIYAITNLADLFAKRGQNNQAFYYLKRAFENDNIDVINKIQTLIIINKDKISLKNNKDLIERLVTILLSKYPDNLDVKTVAYDFYNGMDNHIFALALIKKILEQKTDVYIMWQQALYNASMLENYDEMINIGERAIKIFPNKAELYMFVGMAFFQKQNFDSAYFKLKEGYIFIKELGQNKVQYLIFLAESSYKMKHKNEAFVYYDELLNYDPGNIIVKNNYSYFLALEGEQLEKAKKLSGETILKEPENSTYLDTYGWILYTMGAYDEAKKYLEKAVSNSKGKDPDILFHYAETLKKMKFFSESKTFYLKSEELGFDKEIIKQKLIELSNHE